MKVLVSVVRPALVMIVLYTVACGIVYPAVVLGAAQALFPHQASGSPLRDDGAVVGSELVGQPFRSPGYFWGRPSAIGTFAYDASTSGGSNAGPLNAALHDAVAERVAALRAADPGNPAPVPVDLVTASASGLDPHISPAAARYQVPRVARVRGLDEATVTALVEARVEGRTLGILGEPRVNVVALNRALDDVAAERGTLTTTP